MTAFFRSLVTPALDRLLQLLGRTLLTTPTLEQLPQVGSLWQSSWQMMLGCYGMVVLLAGILVMGYETLQTRASIKELLPRVLMGFLAGALSLWVCTQAITIANALTASIMADGINTDAAARALAEMLTSAVGQNAFTLFLGVFLVGMLVALLLSYIIRVALTIILITAAPLALMAHALPHTDGIARWWWKAFAGCLAIQLGQSLTLITAMRVFLTPGGYTFFGPTPTGLVNLLVALALMYVLFKIPFWILGSIRTSGGKSFVGSLVKGFLAYKTFGLVRGGSGGGKAATARGTASTTASPDPYATPRSTPDGQYTLPLPGLKRGKPPKPPHQRYAPKQPRTKTSTAHQGRQLSLPMDGEWPENKPQLGRDDQYQLPLNVQRQRTAASPAETPTPSAPTSPTSRNQQLKLPSDGEWPENKPRLGADGQYRLPIQAQRVRRPTPPPPPPNPTPRSGRSRQMKLPADGEWPEHKPRADRDGQYRLPLNVRRTRKPTPPPPETPPEPPPSRKKPRGRQQSLPLNLPTKNSPRSRRKGDQQ